MLIVFFLSYSKLNAERGWLRLLKEYQIDSTLCVTVYKQQESSEFDIFNKQQQLRAFVQC